jgi:hypothetical protein
MPDRYANLAPNTRSLYELPMAQVHRLVRPAVSRSCCRARSQAARQADERQHIFLAGGIFRGVIFLGAGQENFVVRKFRQFGG